MRKEITKDLMKDNKQNKERKGKRRRGAHQNMKQTNNNNKKIHTHTHTQIERKVRKKNTENKFRNHQFLTGWLSD